MFSPFFVSVSKDEMKCVNTDVDNALSYMKDNISNRRIISFGN